MGPYFIINIDSTEKDHCNWNNYKKAQTKTKANATHNGKKSKSTCVQINIYLA